MDEKKSNMYQAKLAVEEIRRKQSQAGVKSSEKRADKAREAVRPEKRSHTFHPKTKTEDTSPCRYCHEEGHQIKSRGVLTCPKLVAKEQREANEQAKRRARERVQAQAWSKQFQEECKCDGEGWKTAGIKSNLDSWRSRQLAKQEEEKISYKRSKLVVKNRFDLPSDSDDEAEEGPRTAKPVELAASNVWSKGAPKAVITPVDAAKQPASPPILSWADECENDSDYLPGSEFWRPVDGCGSDCDRIHISD